VVSQAAGAGVHVVEAGHVADLQRLRLTLPGEARRVAPAQAHGGPLVGLLGVVAASLFARGRRVLQEAGEVVADAHLPQHHEALRDEASTSRREAKLP
jgi:hypothetical protein